MKLSAIQIGTRSRREGWQSLDDYLAAAAS